MSKNPEHIGIILDGNRRFAKRLMIKPWKGHEFGYKKTRKLLAWCRNLNIREVTLYCFSMQNFNRPKKEFDYLMNIFEKAFNEFAEDKDVHKNKIRLRVIGRPHLLPEKVQKAIKKAVAATKNYKNYVVNLALAYGGREELIDAMKRVADDLEKGKLKPADLNEKKFSEYLYMSDEPDLIIRTGGEKRTSNFLIWQSNYSEWFFLEKMWPEFEEKDLIYCINEYKRRERRFGK